MGFKEFSEKKFLRVPVLYWIGAGVVAFGVVAWRMKPSPEPKTDSPSDTTGDVVGDVPTSGDSLYDGLGGTSTPVPIPSEPAPTTGNSGIITNDQWISQGVTWLVAQNKATGGEALSALTNFIDGADLTYDQGTLRDLVIEKYGPPPQTLGVIGSTAPAVAKRQFPAPPGVHTIKGSSDNTYGELAQLYYGSSANQYIDLLQAHNISLGHSGPFPVGTKVTIPAYSVPKYFTATTTTRTDSAIASKNGISVAALHEYNDTISFPVAVGVKVRVG